MMTMTTTPRRTTPRRTTPRRTRNKFPRTEVGSVVLLLFHLNLLLIFHRVEGFGTLQCRHRRRRCRRPSLPANVNTLSPPRVILRAVVPTDHRQDSDQRSGGGGGGGGREPPQQQQQLLLQDKLEILQHVVKAQQQQLLQQRQEQQQQQQQQQQPPRLGDRASDAADTGNANDSTTEFLQQQLEQQQQRVEQAERQEESMRDQLQSVQHSLAKRKRELHHKQEYYESQLSELRHQLNETKSLSLLSTKAELEQLQEELNERNVRLKELESRNQEWQATIRELEDQCTAAKERCILTDAKHAHDRTVWETRLQQVESDANNTVAAAAATWQAERDALRTALEEQAEATAAAARQLVEETSNVNTVEVQQLQVELDNQTTQLHNQTVQIQELQRTIQELLSQRTQAEERYIEDRQRWKRQLVAVESQNGSSLTVAEAVDLQAERDTLNAALEESQRQAIEWEEQLQIAVAAVDAAERRELEWRQKLDAALAAKVQESDVQQRQSDDATIAAASASAIAADKVADLEEQIRNLQVTHAAALRSVRKQASDELEQVRDDYERVQDDYQRRLDLVTEAAVVSSSESKRPTAFAVRARILGGPTNVARRLWQRLKRPFQRLQR